MQRILIRRWLPAATLLSALLVLAGGASAQHGYPLVGSWHGTWTPKGSDAARDITLIMNWDGKVISGIINPGYNSMKIDNASLDAVDGWKLHLEGKSNPGAEKAQSAVLDGHLEKAPSVNREIVGTWTQGSESGPVHFVRDY